MAILLVTGATGAAGGPVLDRLLASTDVEEVHVLTRLESDPRAITRRSAPVVHIVGGDVTRERLGLDAATAGDLAGRVTGILHMAADTRFAAPLEALRAVNVEGTRQVVAFARRCPRLDRLVALSTVYVAGRRTGPITERELEHDAGFVNDYERSKHEAEHLLRSAMAALPVSVVRISTILGSARDGSVARPAAIHHALRFYYQSLAPMLPGTDASPVDLIALEYAADAVATLAARAFHAGATYHVCAGAEAPALGALLDETLACFLRFRPAWRRRAIERPAIVPLETFERFARSVEELEDSALSQCVAAVRPFAPQLAYPKVFDDEATRGILEGSGVRRPPFAGFYPRVIQHLIERHWSAGAAAVAS